MHEPWNVNIHYDLTLDRQVPPAAKSVLDVGCGDGFLAARLARRVPHVVALDIDEPVLGRARSRFPNAPITWRHGDVLTDDLECGFFDAVVSNATLHHLGDAFTSLRRLGTLVRPGGVLAVVTFPCMQWRDLPWGAGLVPRPDGCQPSPWQVGTHCPAIVAAPGHLSATAGSKRRGVARGSYFPPSLRSVSHLLAAAAEH